MTPVLPCSTSNGLLFPGATIVSRNSNHLARYNILGKSSRQALVSHRFLLPLSLSGRLYPNYRSVRSLKYRSTVHRLAATGTDTAVEEAGSAVAGEDGGTSELVSTSEEPSTKETVVTPPSQSKQPRPARRSSLPTVKNEELVPGATFTGKVRSIQPFGAFVDFGAFSNGLVHVSQLSNGYVKDVGSVVSVGEEVKVRIIEANISTGRISLSMREADDSRNLQQQNDDADSTSNDRPKPSRRNPRNANQKTQVTSKFVQGQELQGTVKNLTRAGAFISLPEGEEGFLPTSEQLNGEFRMRGSSLETGQEVSVRVLRISRGQATLTMKKEVSMEELESKLTSGEIVGSNAFVRAFRKNKDIATFLDEREKLQKSVEASLSPKTSEVQDQLASSNEDEVTVPSSVEASVASVDAPPTEPSSIEENLEGTNKTTQEEVSSDIVTSEGIVEEAPVTSGMNGNESSPPPVDGVEEDQTSTIDVHKEVVASEAVVADTLLTEPSSIEETQEVSSKVLTPEGTEEQALVTDVVNGNSNESNPAKEVESDQILPSESVDSAEVTSSKNVQTQASDTSENEMPSELPPEDEKVESIPENGGSVSTSGQEINEPAPQESTIKATISPALVKQLREETGAGMMDCKKALSETGGDIVKAQEFLRKKGLASADKKASRATAEGRIGSYIHDSRIGVLIEVNCETDFVSRGEIFKELVDDLAMQVAACPQVQYLVTDDVSEDIVNKEREIEMQKEDLLSKPEQIRSKIVEGRISKRLQELALLEQPYIKNDKVVVKDWVKQTIATIGENIKVNRFVRFNLGEGLERKSQDFAAEVAAQTASKPSPAAPTNDQPAVVEVQEAVEKSPTVAVSAALVKKLREETGAGMMDCKKALAETGADLEKAQEYLRKKGLSTADKKSSRLAAEGRIGSYIHDSRIGVLIEVNCETDFVGRSENFKELVDDLAMQVAACPQVQVVSIEDIPESIRIKEKEMEMQREDLQSKPENIREKIVEGRVSKRLGELALLEQPFIKNDSLLVKDLVKQTVAALGENIKVRRFVRFTLGENIEKDVVKAETEA